MTPQSISMTLPRPRQNNTSSRKKSSSSSYGSTKVNLKHPKESKQTKRAMELLSSGDTGTSLRLKASMIRLRAEEQRLALLVQEIKSSATTTNSWLTHRFETRRNLSTEARSLLLTWLKEHLDHPYPNPQDKIYLAEKAKVSIEQVGTWFVNARVRTVPKLLAGQPSKKKLKR